MIPTSATLSRDALTEQTSFIIDLDGTLYRGRNTLPGAIEFVDALVRLERRFVLCSNNSSITPAERLERLRAMGFDLQSEHVVTSLDVLIEHLKTHWSGKRVYALATRSVEEFLESSGVALGLPADVVVLTYDTELTYKKLVDAHQLLKAGMGFIATHPDVVCPTEHGDIPDLGSFLALLAASTDRNPEILGKPHKPMLDFALKRMGGRREDVVVLGDRLYTDIRMANDAGLRSMLVLTGEAKREDLFGTKYQPTYVVPSVRELLPLLPPQR